MTDEAPKMYCANHPNVETTLRCNKCEKPICARCAILTPTGYRCKECVRGQQKVFETAKWLDYPLIFIVVAILAYLGSMIAFRLGFFIIILAPIAGGLIAEIARFSYPAPTFKRFIHPGSNCGSNRLYSAWASSQS